MSPSFILSLNKSKSVGQTTVGTVVKGLIEKGKIERPKKWHGSIRCTCRGVGTGTGCGRDPRTEKKKKNSLNRTSKVCNHIHSSILNLHKNVCAPFPSTGRLGDYTEIYTVRVIQAILSGSTCSPVTPAGPRGPLTARAHHYWRPVWMCSPPRVSHLVCDQLCTDLSWSWRFRVLLYKDHIPYEKILLNPRNYHLRNKLIFSLWWGRDITQDTSNSE